MVKTVAIIQARMGSTRFPGKVAEDLAGKPVLRHVIDRCKNINRVDAVVCAFPKDSMALIDIAMAASVPFVLGDEHDVLSRYYKAAVTHGADIIVRITADCPLIDPAICNDVIALRAYRNSPYASNVQPRTFPHGLDCEAFTMDMLMHAKIRAKLGADREHVTPHIIREAARTAAHLTSGFPELAQHRWTLDWPEDLAFLRALHEAGNPSSMERTLAILEQHPELSEINAMRRAA